MRSLPTLLLLLASSAQAIVKGVNYYGIETERKDFDCTWHKPFTHYVDKLHEEGFNHYRIPVSKEYIDEGNFDKLDEFVGYIKKYPETNFTLDMHRIFSTHQGVDIFEGGTTLTQFCDSWVKVISRYTSNPQFYGIDVFNEYQLSDYNYWSGLVASVVIKIEEAVPDRLHYFVGGTNWGGSLYGVDLEYLPFSDRISYTIHKYIFSVPAGCTNYNYEQDWEFSFYKPIRHKISVGEWGFKVEEEEQRNWALRFIAWLKKNGVRDTFFWTSAGNSGDTNALWKTDCETFEDEKMAIIKSLWEEKRNLRNCRFVGWNGCVG
jgi:hypothetical protein